MDKKYLYFFGFLIVAGGGFAFYYFFLRDSENGNIFSDNKNDENENGKLIGTGTRKPELNQDINISTPPIRDYKISDYEANKKIDASDIDKKKKPKNLKSDIKRDKDIAEGKGDVTVNTKDFNLSENTDMSNAPVNTGDITNNNYKNINKSFDTSNKNLNVKDVKKINNKNRLDLKGRVLNN